MKNIKYIIILCAVLLLVVGCTDESPLISNSDMVVVQAYVYANEPVTDIRLTGTLALGSEQESAPPINDANVSLIKDGIEYDLTASAGDSGYYHYEGDDLDIQADDDIELVVSYKNQTVTSQTTVPMPPEDLTIDTNTLIIEEMTWPPQRNDSTSTINVSWKEDKTSLFYVVMDNVEEASEEIVDFGFGGGPGKGMGGPQRFMSLPMSMNEYRIMRFNVTHYGKHRVRVYRVNQEYADLYSSRNQDSRDLNEPLTNIENGLGIFSAFNSVEVYFNVIAE